MRPMLRLSGDGAEPVGPSPEQFSVFLKSEIDKWTRVAKAAGIKPE
jgi:tripartite-type tricarboxylate transporter receptor subunit TctC